MAPSLYALAPSGNPKLLDQVRDVTRRKHYCVRTKARESFAHVPGNGMNGRNVWVRLEIRD